MMRYCIARRRLKNVWTGTFIVLRRTLQWQAFSQSIPPAKHEHPGLPTSFSAMDSLKHCHAVLVLGLSACASPYNYTADAGSAATIRVTGNNSNFYTEAYENGNCEPSRNGIRLATFFGPTKDAASSVVGKTVQIPSGRPFVLTHRYIDARVSQNRTCSVTVSFVPEQGQRYQTYFYVDPEVNGCDALVSGPNTKPGESVPSFKYNESLCLSGANQGAANRRAIWIDWRFNFHGFGS